MNTSHFGYNNKCEIYIQQSIENFILLLSVKLLYLSLNTNVCPFLSLSMNHTEFEINTIIQLIIQGHPLWKQWATVDKPILLEDREEINIHLHIDEYMYTK